MEIARRLYQDRVLLVDPNSKLGAFDRDEGYELFSLSSVQWICNVTFDGEARESLGRTFQILYNDFLAAVDASWGEDVLNMLYTIGTEEVMQYVYVKAEENRVVFGPEKKTREIARQLLQDFSVSEIYYFVKLAVEKAHLFYNSGRSKGMKHAANTIPKKMLELGERAKAENWETYKPGRDSRAPRSAVSHVFFDMVFRGDDYGFTIAPGIYWDRELRPTYFAAEQEQPDQVACSECQSTDVEVRMVTERIVVTCSTCGVVSQYLGG